jgi:hypothetical protein
MGLVFVIGIMSGGSPGGLVHMPASLGEVGDAVVMAEPPSRPKLCAGGPSTLRLVTSALRPPQHLCQDLADRCWGYETRLRDDA